MHRILIPFLLLVLSLFSLSGGAASRIELVDGTQINGDVVSISNGRYVIRSPMLGEIEIPESSIRSIKPGGDAGSGSVPNADILAIQKQIASSPELMQLVNALLSDPQLQAAMKDPQLMQSVMSGDIESLRNDPRILQLMANPSIQEIIGKMNGSHR